MDRIERKHGMREFGAALEDRSEAFGTLAA
jgi:hypothetical protein